MSSTIDLDAFLNETVGEGRTITLLGREWRLARELPALLMLRLQAGDSGILNDASEMTLLKACFNPPEQVDEMVEAGLGWSGLTVVTQVAVGVLSGRDPDEVLADLRATQATNAGDAAQGEAEGPTVAPTP